jgi:hypothetical protein
VFILVLQLFLYVGEPRTCTLKPSLKECVECCIPLLPSKVAQRTKVRMCTKMCLVSNDVSKSTP